MGWRGTLRTLGAISRAAERDARRRAREHTRQLAELEKFEAKERAAEAVQEFEEFLSSLVSAHKVCSKPINWHAKLTATPPVKPPRHSKQEEAAKQRLIEYSPSIFARLLGRTERAKADLEKRVISAHEADEILYVRSLDAYQKALVEHEDEKELSMNILAGDAEATLEFLKTLNPFSSIAQLGESLRISIPLPKRVAVELEVHGDEVIPKESAKLLTSGRVSRKAMPRGDYNRLYQDHVCSSGLRVVREVFAALPAESVVVTAVDELLDSSTGNLAKTPILSFLATRQTFAKLNFEAIDPSDAMRNFVHNMDFKPTTGFRAVTALDPAIASK
jgi:hypothetical protein